MNVLSLCDEVLQLIIYELNDPSSLSIACKRFYGLSKDPYVRASYFLIRYGETQAIYHALGRGKLITPRVLDILISSGAHLSRYLVQVAMHHYFHTTSHFIKTPWVRSVELKVFLYFIELATTKYNDIPRGKGDDDGSIFLSFIKESRFPSHLRHINWETIRDILDKYHFIPFSNKDPIMAQFPLALALEPRLLPYAVANGFYMDSKYRDFVFRKIFERPASADRGVEEIVQNVRELCRLDKTMFVSRTVAAEVCMESKANELGYSALKQLNKSGDLLFELATVVEDLLKLFLRTRSSHNSQILRQLFTDFPSSDPSVRIVLLMTVFTNPEGGHVSSSTIKSRLEPLKLSPLTRMDICNVFINPFLERFNPLLEYLRTEIQRPDGGKGMDPVGIRALVEDVAVRCLELECKGKMLKKLHDGYPTVRQAIVRAVLTKHRINLEDLPPAEDITACTRYRPKLCRSYFLKPSEDSDYFWDGDNFSSQDEDEDSMHVDSDGEDGEKHNSIFLGHIGQESLSTMIRQDELMPVRARRRSLWSLGSYMNSLNASQLPYDSLPVGRWIKDEFGPESSVTAVLMTHAILNNHSSILRYYLSDHHNVPITLKHFKLLAHLGKAPNFFLYSNIQAGAKFFRDEDEYIAANDSAKALLREIQIKTESSPPSIPPPSRSEPEIVITVSRSTPRKRKRPCRTATTSAPSYVVPDSDDEAIVVENDYDYDVLHEKKRKKKLDHLQLWIKHLGELLKVEQAKHRAKKKQIESESGPTVRVRVPKNEFVKSLSANLRALRKQDEARRIVFNDHNSADEYSDNDDDYTRRTRTKRRKTTRL